MKALSQQEMRTLVGLLDDEDPHSLSLVQDQILKIGEPILPFLDDLRASCSGSLTARIDALSSELKLRNLKAAFARFSASADCDLEKGTWLVCRVGYPGINPAVYTEWLDKVALGVRRGLPADADHYAVMQQLNITLFQELGFAGNEKRYYDPDNTYLNRVIETRRGIPVSLSVLYLLIGRRLGLPLFGVGTPGHFLVGFRESSQSAFYVDCFHKGRLLNAQDVRRMLLRSGYEFRHEYLDKASNREILARMMRNLISIYQKSGVTERADTLSILVEMILAGRRDQPGPAAE